MAGTLEKKQKLNDAYSHANQRQDKVKSQHKEAEPKTNGSRRNNKNPELNTYSRLPKLSSTAATGPNKKGRGAECDHTP